MTKDNKNFFKKKSQWSAVKDKLLGCYIVPYFQKVLTTGKPILYVDCFAGKGKFEDGNPGSPLIALKARDHCLNTSKQKNINGKIETCFIELNHASELSLNTSDYRRHGALHVISGKYEENIEQVLSNKQGSNIFLYIDPYGIQALDTSIFDKFKAYGFHSLEMLINFNSFGFFRDACRAMGTNYNNDEAFKDLAELVEYDPANVSTSKNSEELLTRIADGDYWKDIVADYSSGNIDGYKAERIFSEEYKKRLKQRYQYVLDMPIRLKPGHRPKYRMIHVCDHADGCFLMAQNMQNRKDELFTNLQQDGQFSLFNHMQTISSSIENDIITVGEIRAKLTDQIQSTNEETRVTKFLANFANKHGILCDFKTLHNILEEMEKAGKVEIVRSPATTSTGRASSFWEESKEKHVIIRRRQA